MCKGRRRRRKRGIVQGKTQKERKWKEVEGLFPVPKAALRLGALVGPHWVLATQERGEGCPMGLTFHSARTIRASSRRPPRVLPRMIQMGICESSCLEMSKVT